MGKQLVGRDAADNFICRETGKFYMDGTLILTPGAKDYLRNEGIGIVYGPRPEKTGAPAASASEAMEETVLRMLKQDYQLTDPEKIRAVCEAVITAVRKQQ